MAFAKLKLILSIRKSRCLLPFGKVKMGYFFLPQPVTKIDWIETEHEQSFGCIFSFFVCGPEINVGRHHRTIWIKYTLKKYKLAWKQTAWHRKSETGLGKTLVLQSNVGQIEHYKTLS